MPNMSLGSPHLILSNQEIGEAKSLEKYEGPRSSSNPEREMCPWAISKVFW
jgi:hypothetical protein